MKVKGLDYDFSWIAFCEDCGEEFECARFIPKKVIRKMLEKENDDEVAWYMGETDNMKVRVCPKCYKEGGY